MADFSHLRLNPHIALRSLAREYPVTDEDWLGICDRIDPPLLPKAYCDRLHWLLDPKIERRGRPRTRDLTDADLVERLRRIEREDVPSAFIEALVERIESGEAYTERDSNRVYYKRWRRKDRDRFICALYNEISETLDETAETFVHPVLGTAALPEVAMPRHKQVLEVINTLLIGKTDPPVPSANTMLSIVSRQPWRKKSRKIASHRAV